jgi:hypothetical protein
MAFTLIQLALLAVSVTPVLGFCGAHTHLDTRAAGEVPIATFGYFGETVGPPPVHER